MSTCLELIRSMLRFGPRASDARRGSAAARQGTAALALSACIALAAAADGRAWSWPLDADRALEAPRCAHVARPRSFDELLWGWRSQRLERLRRVRAGAGGVMWGLPGKAAGRSVADALNGLAVASGRACREVRPELDEPPIYGFGAPGFLAWADPVIGSGGSLVPAVSLAGGSRDPLPSGYPRGVLAAVDLEEGAAAGNDALGLRGSDWKRFEPLSLGFEDDVSLLAPRGYRFASDPAFGVEYRMLPQWIVRAGARLDRAALPAGLGSLQPEDPRMRVGLGLTYAPLARLELDLAYLRAFAPDGSLRVLGDRDGFFPAPPGSPSRIDTDDDLFGVTLRYRF